MTLEARLEALTPTTPVTLGDGTVVSIREGGHLHVEHVHNGHVISYTNTRFNGTITSEDIRAIVSVQRNVILEFFTENPYEALPDMD